MSTEVTSAQIIERAGITYRQLDHWLTSGYLRARRGANNPGSGYVRTFTSRECDVAEVMADLVANGFTPAIAAKLGRRLVAAGSVSSRTLRIERVA